MYHQKTKSIMTLKRRPTFPTVWNTRDEFVAPFSQIFDRMVEAHFPEFKEDFAVSFVKGAYPKVDVIDHNDKVEIIAEIAGWEKEEINIEVEKGILTISGNSTSESTNSGKYLVRELKRSNFQRSFKLSDNLDENFIDAKFENGILDLTIPKKTKEEEQKKTIIIK